MSRQILRFAAGIAVLLLVVPHAFPKSYQASRFDVALGVETGGDLLVKETVDFRFEGGPFTYVSREIPLKESDGLDQFEGYMDGQELRAGAGEMPGLELQSKSSSVRVIWHFPPTSNSSHTFAVKYRARGAVRRGGARDLLLWKAIPPNHAYVIESGHITVARPAGAQLAGQPGASRKATVQVTSQMITYETGRLAKDQGFTVHVPFAEGSILSQLPAWQRESERRHADLVESIELAAAVTIPPFLLGILLIVRLRKARTPHRSPGPSVLTSPPDDLPPVLVGAVRGSWSDWRVALAALLDLGRRGFLEIEAQPKRWWAGRQFVLRRKADPGALRQLDRVLLRLVFGTDQPYCGEVPMRKVQRQLMRRWRQFTRALRQEAQTAGFIEPEREKVRRKWIAVGIILILSAAAGTAVSLIAFRAQTRLLPIVIAVAIGLGLSTLGLLVAVLGATLTRLTDAALNQKQSWDAFRKYLKDLTSRRAELQPEWLASYLPYAVVLGLGNQWAKAFKDHAMPTQLSWLVGANYFDGSEVAALIAVLSSSGAGHSSPGGGAGAGGGGGSSGAG